MPQSRSTSTRLTSLLVAVVIGVTGFVAGTGPAGAAAPTEAPEIIGPDGTSEGTNPILQWEPLEGVTKYKVQVAISTGYSSSDMIWQADTYNVSATPPVDLPLGTVHWRVAGMDGSSVGPFANASFTRERLEGPQLQAPADGSTLEYPEEPVILRWEAVPGMKNYRVEVDDAPDFINAETITTDATNWALLETQTLGQEFYWRVQGQGTPRPSKPPVTTEFSQTWSYELEWAESGAPAVPDLLVPDAGADVTDVVFRWNAVPGAAKYQIQVSPNGDWTNNVTVDETVLGTSFSPDVTLNNTSYFWRVRALSVRSPADAGPWSPDGRQFTRSWSDVPTLRSPEDGDTSAEDYLLQWDPVPFASSYEVNLGTDPNFSPTTFTTCITNHTDWSPYWISDNDPAAPTRPGNCLLADGPGNRGTYLRQGVRYYWRVRGLDQSRINTTPTVLGRFSDTFDFIYLPSADGLPTPIAPTPLSTVGVPELRWEPVRGAERYEVTVSVNGSVQQVASTWSTTYTPSLNVPEDAGSASVGWTVRALQSGAGGGGSSGGSGPVVNGGSFTLLEFETGDGTVPPPPVPTPTPVAPAAGAHAVSPDFDWEPVPGAHHYEVRLFPAGAPVYTLLGDENESPGAARRNPYRSALTHTKPIAPGTYEWQVLAYGDGGLFLSQSELVPLTIDPLAVATPTAPANCGQGMSCAVERSTPLLRWDPVAGAGFYRVLIALDPDFTNVKHIYTTTQAALRPTHALPDNQAGQSYYWFVQPCRSIQVCGRADSGVYGTARAFRKGSRPITPTAPADDARVADLVTFSWQAPSLQWVGSDPNDDVEARTYRIQVSNAADFSTIIDTAEVDQRTYTPWDDTYPEGPLWWRVQARDATGNYLTFSPARKVTKASPRPVVTTPSNGDEVNGLPVIQWEPQAFAASYEVEYYRNGDVTWATGNRVQTTDTQLAADTMVKSLAVGTYAYRVRRIDVEGKPGPWSSDPPPGSSNPADGDRRTFKVVADTPSPTAPANGAGFSRPRVRLEWDPVPGAASYRVETSMSNGFSSIQETVTTVMSAWSLLEQHPNGTVYWRVHALNGQGTVISTSVVRNFVYDLTRPKPAITKVIAGPASVLVQWTALPSSTAGPFTSFVVTPYVGSVKGTPVTVAGTATEARITGLVNDTAYRFTVTPYDGDGKGTESNQSASVTPRAVAPFTSADRFLDRQFLDLYGRMPTSAERSQYKNQLTSGVPPATVFTALWNSAPHSTIMPQVTRLYSAFYVRIPDAAGLIYWAGERRKGKSLVSAAEFFARNSEFIELYGTVTNARYVELVYDNVLGRPASAGDKAYWTGELNAGRRTRGTLMIGFSEAAEYQNKFRHEINAALIQLEMLRRTPTVEERDALAADLRAGQSIGASFVEIMATPEYALRAT